MNIHLESGICREFLDSLGYLCSTVTNLSMTLHRPIAFTSLGFSALLLVACHSSVLTYHV